MTENELPTVSVEDLPTLTQDQVLLDVREDDEWAAGHAPGALHIPLAELPARVDEVGTDRAVYVVCRSGGRSARATAWLQENGIDATNVAGGMTAFAAAGREITSDSGQPTII